MALPAERIESATIAVELFCANDPLRLECLPRFTRRAGFHSGGGCVRDVWQAQQEGNQCRQHLPCPHCKRARGRSAPQPGWWDGLIGLGKAFDTDNYFAVCANILGSCYGTTGPSTLEPKTSQPYQASFPAITVRDIVRVQKRLLEILGVCQRFIPACTGTRNLQKASFFQA